MGDKKEISLLTQILSMIVVGLLIVPTTILFATLMLILWFVSMMTKIYVDLAYKFVYSKRKPQIIYHVDEIDEKGKEEAEKKKKEILDAQNRIIRTRVGDGE